MADFLFIVCLGYLRALVIMRIISILHTAWKIVFLSCIVLAIARLQSRLPIPGLKHIQDPGTAPYARVCLG